MAKFEPLPLEEFYNLIVKDLPSKGIKLIKDQEKFNLYIANILMTYSVIHNKTDQFKEIVDQITNKYGVSQNLNYSYSQLDVKNITQNLTEQIYDENELIKMDLEPVNVIDVDMSDSSPSVRIKTFLSPKNYPHIALFKMSDIFFKASTFNNQLFAVFSQPLAIEMQLLEEIIGKEAFEEYQKDIYHLVKNWQIESKVKLSNKNIRAGSLLEKLVNRINMMDIFDNDQ